MENKRIRVGIIGCGTIGSELAKALEKKFLKQAKLFALCDLDEQRLKALKARLSQDPKGLSIEELIKACDLVIEAASAKISFAVAREALQQKKDVMIMSVGGVLDQADQLFALARSSASHLYLPSGALCGLDAVKAAAMAKIERVTLVTRKPPKGLTGAPYLEEKGIDLSRVQEETVVFEGTAPEAVRGFPKNVNVCAVLSLAGVGAEKTRVKIITSPDYTANTHEIEVEGDFGKLVARSENRPSPENPKTSFLASLSAIATLKGILDSVTIGT